MTVATSAARRGARAASRPPAATRTRSSLVAVTKGFDAAAVDAAWPPGSLDLGENYAQELVAKARRARPPGVRWHFIGRLQRNKVRSLAPHVALWQSVDRPELGRRDRPAGAGGRGARAGERVRTSRPRAAAHPTSAGAGRATSTAEASTSGA